MTHREVSTSTAVLPALALPLPAATETADPAIAAVRRWIEASQAERAYHYTGDNDRESDPTARKLEAEFDRTHWEMAQTAPTTAEGLALLLVALTYDRCNFPAGARIEDAATWDDPSHWADGRDDALVRTAMSSPVAAELVRRVAA